MTTPSKALAPEDKLALIFGSSICLLIVLALLSVGFNPIVPSYYSSNMLVYIAAWIFILGFHVVWHLAKERPESPLAYVRHSYFNAERKRDTSRALAYSILLSIFGTLFSLAKKSIPLFNDYSWDPTFIGWDQAIHGQDAWLVLQPYIGNPVITWIIGVFYQLWVLLIYIGGFYFAFFEQDAQKRSHFIVAYVLTWTLIGFVAASIFASVGPCFLEPILGDDHFAPLMAYLHAVDQQYPTAILTVQQNLIDWYHDDTAILGAGISAMPSMHVALAFLVFLALRHIAAWVGLFFGAFTIMIMVGSVHLGLHYAVDGYISIVLTSLIWLLTGAALKRLPLNSRRLSIDDSTAGESAAQPAE